MWPTFCKNNKQKYHNCFVVLHSIFFSLRGTQQFEGQIHSNCFVLLFSVFTACPKLRFTSSMWLTTVQLEFEWNVRCKSWLIDVLLDSMTVLIRAFGPAQGFCLLLLQKICFSFHCCRTACIPGGSICVFALLSDSIQSSVFCCIRHSCSPFTATMCGHIIAHRTEDTSCVSTFVRHGQSQVVPIRTSAVKGDKQLCDEKSYLPPAESQVYWLIIISAALTDGWRLPQIVEKRSALCWHPTTLCPH